MKRQVPLIQRYSPRTSHVSLNDWSNKHSRLHRARGPPFASPIVYKRSRTPTISSSCPAAKLSNKDLMTIFMLGTECIAVLLMRNVHPHNIREKQEKVRRKTPTKMKLLIPRVRRAVPWNSSAQQLEDPTLPSGKTILASSKRQSIPVLTFLKEYV